MTKIVIIVVAGCILGLAGGVIGTYFSIKNTTSKKQKSFMIRFSIVIWVALIVFVSGLFFLPKPYNYLMWIPYGILLPLFIIYANIKTEQIRKEEKSKKENMPQY